MTFSSESAKYILKAIKPGHIKYLAAVSVTALLGLGLGFGAWYDAKHPQPVTYQRLSVQQMDVTGDTKPEDTVKVDGKTYILIDEKSVDSTFR